MFKAWLFRQNQRTSKNEERAGKLPARLFLLTICVFIVLIFTIPLKESLIVSEEASHKVLLAFPIQEGDVFEIRFTHSVNLSPVTDRYEWIGDSIVLRSTTFTAYGAGIPVLQDGLGTGFEHTEEGFSITGIDLPREKIPIMLQRVPDHHLLYFNREIGLLEYADSGTVVTIYVGKVSILTIFLTRLQTP